jgi:LPXTG-site transpeptidase (sortase) family protein
MKQKQIFRFCGIVSGISGLIIIFATLFPIAAYEWQSASLYPMLLNPLPDGEKEYSQSKDLTKASNWFIGGAENKEFVSNKIQYYTMSIPKIKINNATVAIGGEDLAKSLIQYPGTALPGKSGDTIIFGHSILPIFYDPTNYMAIFSTINTLKENDEIYIYYDGITYKYLVQTSFEIRPTDIDVLDQNLSNPYLTLVTCSPPGDPRKLKRLLVRAKLVPFENEYENTGN